MKICYNETLDASNLLQDMELCKKYGYDQIEIRIEYLQEYLKSHSTQELKDALKQHRLTPLAFNSVDNINFCTPKQWDELLERFLFACRMCQELENPYIVVVPTEDASLAEKNFQEIFRDSVDVLRILSGIAAPYGASLAFEPIGNRRWCVQSIRQAAEIVQAVDRDNVGLTLDAMNLYCHCGLADMADLYKIPAGKIFVFHINDSMELPLGELEPEQHRIHPGDGVIPLKEFCRTLVVVGYKGPASLELFNPAFSVQNPEDVIREGSQKTKKLLETI
ncbi:MAG: sugar phosphate isomerase/epimerase [Lachnospiraceae bacterium]|nr:sugar phosphate isomerase/epimerase [Lachnospiraceae bacterium]